MHRQDKNAVHWVARCRRGAGLVTLGLVAALVAAGCTDSPAPKSAEPSSDALPAGPRCVKTEDGDGCLPLAPAEKRVDLRRPSFSNPTSITNPLHPSSNLTQVIYGGQVDGKPFRTEFSRLPQRKTITWDSEQIDVVSWQYLAFSGGRIHEVAIDWFAQADDGAVWYFGEDVFNYEDGVVADTDGTWIAGKDRPPGMIMPGKPQVGDVYRPENIPELVFEEVTVKAVGQPVAGPSGQVSGAVTVTELHFDGAREDKIFAPGYGEFSTGTAQSDLEAVSLAAPTDARPGPIPAGLAALSAAARGALDAAGRNDWTAARTASTALRTAWARYRPAGVPPLLNKQMSRDINAFAASVAARRSGDAQLAALRVAQNDLDLRLRYQPPATVDLARLELWTRQLLVDSAAADAGATSGDVTTLKWTWDRVRPNANPAAAGRIDAQLRALQGAAEKKDAAAVARSATALQRAITALRPR
jgi:hypothetical protein